MILSQVKYETIYITIRDLHDTEGYSIAGLCEFADLCIPANSHNPAITKNCFR